MQHQPSHFSFGSSNIGKCKHHRSSDICLWDFLKLMVVSTILYHLCRWIILLCSFVQAIGKTGSVPCIFVVAVLFWCCALVLERQCKKLQSRSARHGRGLVWLLWRMSAVWSYTLPFSRDVKGKFHKSLCFFFWKKTLHYLIMIDQYAPSHVKPRQGEVWRKRLWSYLCVGISFTCFYQLNTDFFVFSICTSWFTFEAFVWPHKPLACFLRENLSQGSDEKLETEQFFSMNQCNKWLFWLPRSWHEPVFWDAERSGRQRSMWMCQNLSQTTLDILIKLIFVRLASDTGPTGDPIANAEREASTSEQNKIVQICDTYNS